MKVAVNLYAERREGEVCIYLALSGSDGNTFTLTMSAIEAAVFAERLSETLTRARELLEAGDANGV